MTKKERIKYLEGRLMYLRGIRKSLSEQTTKNAEQIQEVIEELDELKGGK